jgi:hypothetical protein
MRERMRMFRILAAPDMAAGKTYAKLIPRLPERNAFLAAVRARCHVPNRAEMLATIVHVFRIPPRPATESPDLPPLGALHPIEMAWTAQALALSEREPSVSAGMRSRRQSRSRPLAFSSRDMTYAGAGP